MYFFLLAVLYPVSLLPLWVLYRISDFAFIIIYRLLGYRKEIVRDNLAHAFPQKSSEEIEVVMRRFYLAFCDQWVETLKLLTMSRSILSRRMRGNWEVFAALSAQDKNSYMLTGHLFNWEWANAALAIHTPQTYAFVYLPLSSATFDRLMIRIRARSGAVMISMKALLSGFKKLGRDTYILGLAADQNPAVVEVADWLPFMNREAPFFRGPEQMPRRAKAAVVMMGIQKERRGYYRATLEKLCDDASEMAPGTILQAYVSFIEKQLEAQPQNWLWSHRRWKHVRKDAPL